VKLDQRLSSFRSAKAETRVKVSEVVRSHSAERLARRARPPSVGSTAPNRERLPSVTARSGIKKFRSALSLAVGVRREIHGSSRDGERQIGPVIDVETPDVVLIRFSLTAMLADNEPRNSLDDVGGTEKGLPLDLGCGNDAGTGRVGNPHELPGGVETREAPKRRPPRHHDRGGQGEVEGRVEPFGRPESG
jgi:hypothetical protein